MNLELGGDQCPAIVFTTPQDDMMGDNTYGHMGHHWPGRKGKLLRLAGWIDMDSRVSVCRNLPVFL